MKNIILYFLFLLLISCNSDDNINCTNNYYSKSKVKISKATVIFKNEWGTGKTIFDIDKNNQIIKETRTSYSKVFIYNECNQLIKRNLIYFNDIDRITENYTQYDENGLFIKHKRNNYSISVIDNINPDSLEVRATLAGNDQYATNGIWKFNDNDRLISDGAYNYAYVNDNLISQEVKDSGEKTTAEYYDLLNPISIFKLNTYGKRNTFFYASDTFDTLYYFDQKVIDNSKNLPKKIVGLDKEITIKILKQKGNIATNFIIEYSVSSVFLHSYEYLLEIE